MTRTTVQRDFRRWRAAGRRDVGAASAVHAAYGLTAMSDGGDFVYEGAGDDDVSIRSVALGAPLSGSLAPRRDHIVLWTNDGTAVITDVHGHTVRLEAGRPTVVSAAGSYTFSVDAAKLTMVHLSDGLLRDVAADLDVDLDDPLVFDVQDPVVFDVAPFGAVVHRYGGVVADPDAPRPARSVANAAIAAAVLDVFPRIDPDGLSNDRLRDAVGFVHAHAQDDLAVDDIAAATAMSVRGLQALFERTLGTTPVAYLRDVRLGGVRDELRVRSAAETSVGKVARVWGFRHLGRFAQSYRLRYGELPQATLRTPVERTPLRDGAYPVAGVLPPVDRIVVALGPEAEPGLAGAAGPA